MSNLARVHNNPINNPRPAPRPAPYPPAPAPARPAQSKRGSVKLTLWNTVGRELNLIKKGANGILQIPRKGSPEYDKIRTEYDKRKQAAGLQ